MRKRGNKIKIILTFEDVEKLILDSYDGVKDVSVDKETTKSVNFVLNVEGDIFKRKKETDEELKSKTKTIPPFKINVPNEFKPGTTVDYDSLLAEREIVESESIIPEVKTLEEKNKEATKKGLMTSGRSSDRPMSKM